MTIIFIDGVKSIMKISSSIEFTHVPNNIVSKYMIKFIIQENETPATQMGRK